jgi:hypothetical protein
MEVRAGKAARDRPRLARRDGVDQGLPPGDLLAGARDLQPHLGDLAVEIGRALPGALRRCHPIVRDLLLAGLHPLAQRVHLLLDPPH